MPVYDINDVRSFAPTGIIRLADAYLKMPEDVRSKMYLVYFDALAKQYMGYEFWNGLKKVKVYTEDGDPAPKNPMVQLGYDKLITNKGYTWRSGGMVYVPEPMVVTMQKMGGLLMATPAHLEEKYNNAKGSAGREGTSIRFEYTKNMQEFVMQFWGYLTELIKQERQQKYNN